MPKTTNRRSFLIGGPLGMVGLGLASSGFASSEASSSGALTQFPHQDAELVQAVVGASHSSIERVTELVKGYPELAKSSWDWGFGDWESALGAASHTGRVEIAEFLLAHGARPNLFTAAMLGQLAVVKAVIEASPGIQRSPGPHGITLLAHARAGRERAAAVYDYLLSLGDADPKPVSQPIVGGVAPLLGSFRYGRGDDEALVITERDGAPYLERQGQTQRGLTHLSDLRFHPAGAPSVQIVFKGASPPSEVVVTMGLTTLTAVREA